MSVPSIFAFLVLCRDEMLLQQKAAAEAAVQQQGLLQRIGRLQEQKLQLEKHHVDQLAASTRAFSEALQQAQHRAVSLGVAGLTTQGLGFAV